MDIGNQMDMNAWFSIECTLPKVLNLKDSSGHVE